MHRAVLAALFAAYASAQTPANSHPKNVPTSEQIAHQQSKNAAIAAYNAELAREKAPLCPNANTTYDINMCLGHEIDLTNANYKAFTTALRAMLSGSEPAAPGEGPTGPYRTPATNTAAFDAAESAWQAYTKAECAAVDTLWRGGTIVNAMVGECALRMARARMHELDTAYDQRLLHPH